MDQAGLKHSAIFPASTLWVLQLQDVPPYPALLLFLQSLASSGDYRRVPSHLFFFFFFSTWQSENYYYLGRTKMET